MLSETRILDLTNEWGLMAGSMLADLGADVIQVEPPGGSLARRLAPFARNAAAPEDSLFWWAYARNKRGTDCRTVSLFSSVSMRRQRMADVAIAASEWLHKRRISDSASGEATPIWRRLSSAAD